jgi:uncharacterized repeat protein (TIGR01451 family)
MKSRLSTAALVVYVLTASGCAYLRVPRIDPSGERIFAEPPIALAPQYRVEPGPPLPDDDVEVILSPQVTVAPVGSEVVLVAGVRGPDGYLRTNRRLEWSLAPGGVGQFVAVGKGGAVDLLLGDFNRPRKVDNTFAVGSTSRRYLQLDRGTPTTEDDICVLRGQGWITLSSPIEGTSHVVVLAPEVHGWESRTRTATVHWVDAQWCFPPPAINPAGSRHVFTTTVMHQTDQSPCVGWPVRYEIVDGPPAGFAPDGAPMVEALTDAAGQARVEIYQQEPGPGTNRINIQVIRPAALGESQGKRIVVASGGTMKTWTSPELALRVTGPAVAGVGTTLSYRIEVSNAGDLPAKDVVVRDELPEGLSYLQSNPAAEVDGRRLQWRLGELGPGERRAVGLDARATQVGSLTHCAEATGARGLKASDCAVATVMAPSVDVKVTGPTQATVGEEVTFEIVITNPSQATATKLLIRDRFDPGLEHPAAEKEEAAERRIERDLGDLAPGQWQRISVTFRVRKTGRLCHVVEVTGANGVQASAQACLTAVEGAARQPAAPSGAESRLSVSKSIVGEDNLPLAPEAGLASRRVGETVRFAIAVSNNGNQELRNLTLVDQYDSALLHVAASDGYRSEKNNLVWTIDSLPAGTTTTFEVNCRCTRAVAKAYNRATVITPQGVRTEDEVCLEVRAAAGGLTISVADLRDPVAVGKGTTYLIGVANQGQTPQRDVTVVASVPLGMIPDRISTSGPVQPTIQGQTIRFGPVAELPAGGTLTYHVVVLAQHVGEFSFRAELTSREQTEPLVGEESTEVVP